MLDLFTGIFYLLVDCGVEAKIVQVYTISDELHFEIQLVILGSEIRSPQIGLQALSRALSQKGVAKKIQVHPLIPQSLYEEQFLSFSTPNPHDRFLQRELTIWNFHLLLRIR